MNIKKYGIIILLIFILTSFVYYKANVNEMSSEEARFKLGQMNIKFDVSNFMDYIKNNDKLVVKLFVYAGIDINSKDNDGLTALMHCCNKEYLETINFLLNNGADVNIKDKDGVTPLMWSSSKGKLEVVKLLIGKGADINIKNNFGFTALMISSMEGKMEIAKLLIDNGADINALLNEKDDILKGNSNLNAKKCIANMRTIEGAAELYQIENGNNNPLTPYDLYKKGYLRNELSCPEGDSKSYSISLRNREKTYCYEADCKVHGKIDLVKVESKSKNIFGSALTLSYLNKHKELVKMLIEKGANFNAKFINKNDVTTLWEMALSTNDTEVVELLINKGADINERDKNEQTPLMHACVNGNAKIAKILINKGANINEKDKNGKTPILLTFENGDSELTELLAGKEKAEIIAKLEMKFIPKNFIEAAKTGQLKKVENFIEAGMSVDVKNDDGKTALMEATSNNQKEVIKLLISKGANINEKDKNGKTSILMACENGNSEIIKLLVGKDTEELITKLEIKFIPENFIDVSRKGQLKIVESFISAGMSVDVKDNLGKTALMEATSNNQKEVIKLLISKGANINEKDKNGKTPILLAYEKGNNEIIELLAGKENTELIKKLEIKFTPENFIEASQKGQLKIVESFIAAGMSVDVKDNLGKTALMEAASKGNEEVIELLLNKGANVNEKDKEGDSALMRAARNGNLKVVKSFIEKGASIDEKDNCERTALIWAAYTSNLVVAEFLIQKGANINIKDNQNKTVMDIAAGSPVLKERLEKAIKQR